MEGSLVLGLSNRTGFLKEVCLDVGSSNVARSVEIDSDEFTLSKKERIDIIELCRFLFNKLTKREELSFLTVLALPKASRIGLA